MCRAVWQVFDISEHRPDKVLAKLYDNIKAAEAAGDMKVRTHARHKSNAATPVIAPAAATGLVHEAAWPDCWIQPRSKPCRFWTELCIVHR